MLRHVAVAVPRTGLGGNTGGNEVGTIASSSGRSCPFVSLQKCRICRQFRGRNGVLAQVGRPPTEPKVTGSNPVGRAPEGLTGRLTKVYGWPVGSADRRGILHRSYRVVPAARQSASLTGVFRDAAVVLIEERVNVQRVLVDRLALHSLRLHHEVIRGSSWPRLTPR